MALLPSSSYLADERGYDNYGAGAMAGAQSSLPFASPAARTFTDQLSGYSAPPPRTAVPPVPHTLHHLNSIRENAGRPSLAPPTAPSPDILSPISAPREYPSFISEALANPNYGLNGENGLETGYGGNGGALSAQPGQQPGQPGQPRTTNAPRPAYTVPLAPPSVTDTDTESLASVHPDWTKAEDPVAAFSQTMAARVTKNTSSRAQLILASFCLDIIALGFIVSSISGTVTWNKTLTWVTYSSATIDGRNGTDIYTGIWGQCTYPLNPTPAFPNKCLMWFDDPWAQNTFGKPYVFAMPILTMVAMLFLAIIPIFAFFCTTGRRSFMFIAISNILANGTWIAAFVLMILLILRLEKLYAPFKAFSFGLGFYFGSVACGLMILSLLIKIIGLVRYRRTKEEMMMSIREKDRREMLAASHTMPAVMVGGRALTREQAAREQAAARYLEEHPDERAEEEHLVTGAGSPPMRMASMRGPGAVGQQQGALGGQGQGIGLMPPPTPEPGPAPALPSVGAPAAASQSQLVRGESSQVVLQQPYYPTPAAPAPARGMQNGVSGSSTDTVVAEPAPVARTGQQQPLKSAMSNKASQPQPQPSRPPQSAAGLTPAQFLASLPAATKAQLEQQIMAQLSQYSQPIADYVRAQYPTASAEQQQGAYAYYMGIYREQIEGEYVKWFMSQGR